MSETVSQFAQRKVTAAHDNYTLCTVGADLTSEEYKRGEPELSPLNKLIYVREPLLESR